MRTHRDIRYAILRYDILTKRARKWKRSSLQSVGLNDAEALFNLYNKFETLPEYKEIKFADFVIVCDASQIIDGDVVLNSIPLLPHLAKNVKKYLHFMVSEDLKQSYKMNSNDLFFEVNNGF